MTVVFNFAPLTDHAEKVGIPTFTKMELLYKFMLVYHIKNSVGESAVTSQLLQYRERALAEQAIKQVQKNYPAQFNNGLMSIIKFF